MKKFKARLLRLLSMTAALCLLAASVFTAGIFAAETELPPASTASYDNFTALRSYDGRFTDIADGDWFAEYVTGAFELGLIDGKSGSSFDPDGSLTYAEAIKLAACLHDIYLNAGAKLVNANAGSDMWYVPYVQYAISNGLLSSAPDNYNAPADRGSVAGYFFAAMFSGDNYGGAALNDIADGDIPDVREADGIGRAVYTLYRAGVLQGSDANGTFNASAPITRAEISAIIIRLSKPESRVSFSLKKSGANETGETVLPDVPVYAYPLTEVKYKYLHMRELTDVGFIEASFKYSDGFWSTDATKLNGDIARASVALTAAAYDADDIKNALTAAGFEVVAQKNYETPDSEDAIAYTVGRRDVGEGEAVRSVYAVAVRGTYTGANEWRGNFNIGETENAPHEGFTAAAAYLEKELKALITTPAEKNTLWLTGHSRGAGAAAILCEKLNASWSLASPSNIYAYVFGSPSYTTNPSGVKNLFVFINKGDVIAGSPFVSWGYKLDGTVTYLPLNAEDDAQMKNAFSSAVGKAYLGLDSVDEYTELLGAWCPTKQQFYHSSTGGTSPYELLIGLFSIDLSIESATQILTLLTQYHFSLRDIQIMSALARNLGAFYHAHSPGAYVMAVDAMLD